MRSKLLGWPTSIAFAIVCTDGRGSKRPVVEICSGTTSLTLVAATNRAIGRPARLAIRPAVRLPKLPLGVQKTHRQAPSEPARCRAAARRRGSSRPSAAAAGRCSPSWPTSAAPAGAARRSPNASLRQPVAVVEAAGHGVGPHVGPLAVEHRQLRFLRRADAAVGIEDDDARVRARRGRRARRRCRCRRTWRPARSAARRRGATPSAAPSRARRRP